MNILTDNVYPKTYVELKEEQNSVDRSHKITILIEIRVFYQSY